MNPAARFQWATGVRRCRQLPAGARGHGAQWPILGGYYRYRGATRHLALRVRVHEERHHQSDGRHEKSVIGLLFHLSPSLLG